MSIVMTLSEGALHKMSVDGMRGYGRAYYGQGRYGQPNRPAWEVIDDAQTITWATVNDAQTITWATITASQTPEWTEIDTPNVV